jgi:energy-coupling factor transport system ATP-binding protein
VHGEKFVGPNPKIVALVPDKVGDYFVTGSLDEELARADKVASVAKGYTKTTFLSLVEPDGSDFARHPLDLSIGTQLALATAMQLSHKPQLLLLDEPVQGLDSRSRAQLAETLRCVQETGCAIVFATHDLFFAKSFADKTISLTDVTNRAAEVGAK